MNQLVFIAMLRGINVSGHKIVKMERLRASFAALGFSDVKTYVQSGNVVFKTAQASAAGLAGRIAGKVLADFGFSIFVLTRTAGELRAVAEGNPLLKLPGVEQTRLYATFLEAAAPESAEARLKPLVGRADRLAVRGRELYLYCPNGYSETKLSNTAIEKKLSVPATTRNWRTVQALVEMAGTGT